LLNHVKVGNATSATITHTLYACASLEIRNLNCHAAQNPAFLIRAKKAPSSTYMRSWNDPYGLPW
jgi:hypothetical protein